MSKMEYKDLIAFHPGYYIKDVIEDMEISQAEFAKRLDISAKTISKLVNGEIPLSEDMALRLSRMFGTEAQTWINLQHTFEKKCLEIEQRKVADHEEELAKMIDYSFFVKLGVVKETRKVSERVSELCSFFKVCSLTVLTKRDLVANFRSGINNMQEKNLLNANAWLQTAINIGKEQEVNDFNADKLKGYLEEIRGMTVQQPSAFMPRLREIFKECGVSFVLLPALKNSGINGAVKWINKQKVILAINNRRSYADIFWFSLFHEIKHILQQKLTKTIVTYDKKEFDEIDKQLEEEADLFAREMLIPSDKYRDFIYRSIFSEISIREFAKQISIHPGIVVGRLQRDEFILHSQYHNLKEKYIIKDKVS